MKLLGLILLGAAAAAAQPIGFGIKVGVPMNDFLDAAQNQNFRFDTTTNRYILGPSVELRLPFGLGVEFDALYRHFNYNAFGNPGGAASGIISESTSSGAWEFPLVAKYRFKGAPLLHPYVEAGVSWDKLSGLSQDISVATSNVINTGTNSNPTELHTDFTRGFVLGGGLDIKALIIHITPGVRYTRWGSKHFIDPMGLLNSNQNQGEFLIGIKF